MSAMGSYAEQIEEHGLSRDVTNSASTSTRFRLLFSGMLEMQKRFIAKDNISIMDKIICRGSFLVDQRATGIAV